MKQIKPAAPTRTAPEGLPAPLLCPLVWLVAGPADLGRAVLAWELSYGRNSSTPSQDELLEYCREHWPHAQVKMSFFAAKKESNAHPLTGDPMEIRQASGEGAASKDIEGEADALGISKRTLYPARKKIGVTARKNGYQGEWRLFLDKERAGGKDS
jgi:hypothetical protein